MGVVVVDCCPNVGHVFEGFVRMEQKVNVPSIYLPIYTDIDHKDWSEVFWTAELVSLFQQGKLNVPGCERPGFIWFPISFVIFTVTNKILFTFVMSVWRLQDDPPAEHLEAPPEPPALKKCTYGKVGKFQNILQNLACFPISLYLNVLSILLDSVATPQVDGQIVTLEIPESIVKQWESKPEFKTYYEEFLGRNPPVKEFKGLSVSKKKTDPSKPGNPTAVLPTKKRRLVEDISGSIVDVSSLPDPDEVLIQVPIVNARAAKKLTTMPLLRITKNGGPMIVNQTGQEVAGQEFSYNLSGVMSILSLPNFLHNYLGIQTSWSIFWRSHCKNRRCFVGLGGPSSRRPQWTHLRLTLMWRSRLMLVLTPMVFWTMSMALWPNIYTWHLKPNRKIAACVTTRPPKIQREIGFLRRQGQPTVEISNLIIWNQVQICSNSFPASMAQDIALQ